MLTPLEISAAVAIVVMNGVAVVGELSEALSRDSQGGFSPLPGPFVISIALLCVLLQLSAVDMSPHSPLGRRNILLIWGPDTTCVASCKMCHSTLWMPPADEVKMRSHTESACVKPWQMSSTSQIMSLSTGANVAALTNQISSGEQAQGDKGAIN